MINKPKVSIMIPTYNQELYIAEAIKSALAQDYENLEVVISDDCSSDNTGKIAQSFLYDDRVKYFKTPQNLGRVGNYHKTLYDYASGDWAVNLDGDDYYTDSTFISSAMKQLLENPGAIFYMASHLAMKNKKKIKSYQPLNDDAILLSGHDYFIQFHEIGGFIHYSLLYSRTIAKEIGFYTFDSLASDFHSGMRLALRGNLILSPKKVGHWRVHATNASRTEIEGMVARNIDCYESISKDAQQFIGEKEANKWLEDGINSVKDTYINTIAATSASFKDIPVLISHFRFDISYTICFVKMILHCFGISRKKEKRFNFFKHRKNAV